MSTTTAAQTTVMDLKERVGAVVVKSDNPITVGFSDAQSFDLAQRIAKLFASSDLVPARYKGNIANCVIGLNMAARIGADPLMVMQNLYVVHGSPAWSAQFMIATFNACGRFSAIRYEWKGEEGKDSWACRAWAMEKETGERIEGAWVSIGTAKSEGWYDKNGSKWKTMPMQMLMYRAASWFIRAYAPEISMGLRTADEVRDTYDMDMDEDGRFSVKVEDMKPEVNAEPDIAGPLKSTVTDKAKPKKDPAPAPAEDTRPEVSCPNKTDSEGNPLNVLTTYCQGKPCKAACPSWPKP
nr:hypothetical protein [uncultured Rhodopila sp.]